uniref:Protocadherin 7a n=1 Tax=Oreochromis niloticus TaxID=8128 RepID=A0A669F1W0_ORENI
MQRLGAVHSSAAQVLSLVVLVLQLLTQLPGADSALRYRVAEEGPPDVKIGNVAADLGLTAGTGSGDVTFALESGSEYFKIDNVTGELTTGPRRIDREKLPQCQMIFDENECFLDFEVSVIGPLQSWVDLFEGRVVITDINDNTPSFPSPVLQLSVEENRPIGTLYLLPTATDRDFGRNGIDRYELIQDGGAGSTSSRRTAGGNPITRVDGLGDRRGRSGDNGGGARSSVFELQVADIPDGEKQPQLIVKGTLDREQKDSYELVLRVRDGGNPPRSSQALLRVSISDVNDNSPQFERSTYEAEMAENAPPGTPVLQVRASDRDIGVNGQVEYVFGAATESVRRLLRLDEATGWLSVLHRIDREEVAQLRFTVMARDRGQPPRTDRTTVVLAVRDENDNVPVVEIRKIGRIPVRDGASLVPENVLVDTPVALVQVSDRDQGENGAVTCTVVGDVPFTLKPAGETVLPPLPADDAFDRNKKKYFLHTSALLDYEATKEYSVTIVAVDSGSPSLSSNSSLMVRVVDINDHAPTFAQSVVEVHFAENNSPGERVVTVVATDADSGKNAEIAYSLDPATNGPFYIDADNGDIRTTGVLDREQRERYELRVFAKDKGTPSLQGSASVVVQVTDRNDNAPKFVQEIFTFYVKENLLANSPVGMVTVTDADEGQNAELSLFVEMDGVDEKMTGEKSEGEDGKKENEELFSIENNTGTIFSSASFDREKLSTYTFRVRAVDGGEPRKTATATVSLFVTDENDNAPAITSPANESYTLLPPASSARTIVKTVTAIDSDTGPNADLHYSLVGGNPFRLFEIGHTNGVITLAEPLERRHRGLHRLVVRVNDSGIPSLCATALVHVFINESLANASLVDAQGTLRRVTFSVVSQPQDGGCYDSGLEDSETPSSKSSSGPRLGALPLPEEGYERTTPEGSVGEEEHVENDARQLPDVALTGKCTRECDEFGHSDTCWMPVRSSPRPRQRHGSDPPRLSTFAPGDDNNNLRGNDHESDSESAGSAGSSEPGVVVGGEGQRLPLANGDPLGTLGRGNHNRNMGDHNRNLLNRKMTSASYDTFSSAGFGRRQQEEGGGEGQNPPEVIPLTRTGGDYKTTSCLTLSRREVYL